jgi:hypothetical protein
VKTGRHESEARYVARAYGISVKQLRTYGFNRFMQLSPTARQVVLNDMRRSRKTPRPAMRNTGKAVA